MSLTNVIQIFRARYARMANDDAGALAAANLVSRTSMSTLSFPAPAVNFYANVTGGTNGIAPRRQYRTSMTGGDQRFSYFVTPSTTLTGRVGALLDPFSRYANPQAVLPVYFPDEALLIKAEALANQNQLAGIAGGARFGPHRLHRRSRHRRSEGVSRAPRRRADAGTVAHRDLRPAAVRVVRHRSSVGGCASSHGDSRSGERRREFRQDGQRCWLPYAVGDRNANPNATFAALPDPIEPSTFPASCPTT